jgi:hypothetical protein
VLLPLGGQVQLLSCPAGEEREEHKGNHEEEIYKTNSAVPLESESSHTHQIC